MKTWFNSLSPRERTLVIIAATATLLLLFWLLLVKPLFDKNARLNKVINSQTETLKKMQSQSIQIKRLQQQQTSKPIAASNRNPQQLIERSLQTWRLKPSLERMQSQGANSVRVILKNANADRVMRFLYELENKSALSISEMVINNRKKESGFADVRLTITKSSK